MDIASLAGPGVHSGAPGKVEFLPRGDGSGIRFFFPGSARPLAPRDLADLPRKAQRSTLLGEGASVLRTPEHMLAALLFFPDLSLDVRCGGPELPGLDGSALPFRDALARLSPAHAAAPAWREYDCAVGGGAAGEGVWEHRWAGGFLRAEPARSFAVTYELDHPALRQSYRLDSAAAAWTEILPARTFAFLREWRAAQAAGSGLMAGAGTDSGLLLAESEAEFAEWRAQHPEPPEGPYPLLNQGAWRMRDEPVKHKVLDLLGDLALRGLALPRLHIHCRNGGHYRNHLLLSEIARTESSGNRGSGARFS